MTDGFEQPLPISSGHPATQRQLAHTVRLPCLPDHAVAPPQALSLRLHAVPHAEVFICYYITVHAIKGPHDPVLQHPHMLLHMPMANFQTVVYALQWDKCWLFLNKRNVC